MARPTTSVWAIVVAAGSGTRVGAATPKQYMTLGDRLVIDWALDCLDGLANVVLVVAQEYVESSRSRRVSCVVVGGSTRSDSVRAGLAAIPDSASVVLVHDAARPFCTAEVVGRVLAAVKAGADAVVPAIPVVDTIKRVSGSRVESTLDRSKLVAVQTPQGFRAAALRKAHAGAPEATDDAALVEAVGGRVEWVAGDAANRKLTTIDDLPWFQDEADRRSISASGGSS